MPLLGQGILDTGGHARILPTGDEAIFFQGPELPGENFLGYIRQFFLDFSETKWSVLNFPDNEWFIFPPITSITDSTEQVYIFLSDVGIPGSDILAVAFFSAWNFLGFKSTMEMAAIRYLKKVQ